MDAHLNNEGSSDVATSSSSAISDHDYHAQVSPFSLAKLPIEVLCSIVGYLKQDDKMNLRLVSRWFNDTVTLVDLTPRKWNIRVTKKNYIIIKDTLNTIVSKLENFQNNPIIEIGLIFTSKSLTCAADSERKEIIQYLLSTYRKYVTGLYLMIKGNEQYLGQTEYYCPNLKFLLVDSISRRFSIGNRLHSQECSFILVILLKTYRSTVKSLETLGEWKINPQLRNYPLSAIQTVNICQSYFGTLRELILISKELITTLELDDILGDSVTDEECIIPNLKHLHIDADTMDYFNFVRANAERIESLVIYLEEKGEDIYIENLPKFPKLKLLEVNCPNLLNSILQQSTTNVKYLYVPTIESTPEWSFMNLDLPIQLPAMTDLCVDGSKRWSINMIKKNCESLEFLILYGYTDFDNFLDPDDMSDNDDMLDNENVIMNFPIGQNFGDVFAVNQELQDEGEIDDGNNHEMIDEEDNLSHNSDEDFDDMDEGDNYLNEERKEYCWPDLVAMDCFFPNLKILLLPECNNVAIVQSLKAKCLKDNIEVITDRERVGEIVRERIEKNYDYTRYIRMMNYSLSKIFESSRSMIEHDD